MSKHHLKECATCEENRTPNPHLYRLVADCDSKRGPEQVKTQVLIALLLMPSMLRRRRIFLGNSA